MKQPHLSKTSKNINQNKELSCEYCNKQFSSEKILINHTCEQKRRWLWKDEKYIQVGFFTYNRFYKQAMKVKKEKTYAEFVKSKYFTSFTKFGKYAVDANIINIPAFIDYLIKNNIKLDTWTQNEVYTNWLTLFLKKENIEDSVERSLKTLEKWSLDTNNSWTDFFEKVNSNIALSLIKSGKLSPCILYMGFGMNLFDKISNEDLSKIKDIIDPIFWDRKMKINQTEVNSIKNILISEGLKNEYV